MSAASRSSTRPCGSGGNCILGGLLKPEVCATGDHRIEGTEKLVSSGGEDNFDGLTCVGKAATDGLKSYGAALKELGAQDKQVAGRWENNRVENSHQPFRRRERAMLRFRRMQSLQTFASFHSSVHNLFNTEPSRSSRSVYKQASAAALAEWRGLCAG